MSRPRGSAGRRTTAPRAAREHSARPVAARDVMAGTRPAEPRAARHFGMPAGRAPYFRRATSRPERRTAYKTERPPGPEPERPSHASTTRGRGLRRRSSPRCRRLAGSPLGRASVGPRLPSPGRMAIPPGSSERALRVGSGRGPTVRTAPRGARSGWVKHATGFTCPSGVTTGIDERLSPWLRRHSPPISRPCRLPFADGTGGPLTCPAGVETKIGACEHLASACLYSV
jgi:hypothetical protein